jgi:hypothetical protein
MGSWGASDAAEHKPRFLTDVEKRSCAATTAGWTVPAGGNGNPAADREVLVTIGDLSSATGLNIADISSINWDITAFDKSEGATLSVTVNYNELVAVTGTPKLVVTNDSRANHDLTYASGTGTNRLTFTLAIAADDAATSAGDVLSIGENAIAQVGGSTIAGSDGAAATITNVAGIGTAAGTITVVA